MMKKALSFHHGICSTRRSGITAEDEQLKQQQQQQRPTRFLPDIRSHKHHTSMTQYSSGTMVQGQVVVVGGGETKVKGSQSVASLGSSSRRDSEEEEEEKKKEEEEEGTILGLKAHQFAAVVDSVLEGLTREGDRLPYDPQHQLITRFHQRQPPAVSVRKYLERIMKYSHCSDECYVLALVYLDRIVHKNPTLFISSHNIHRLLITSIMEAIKFFDDRYYNNIHYAQVGGVGGREINRLESEFLSLIDNDLHVTPAQFETYRSSLVSHNCNNKRNVATTINSTSGSSGNSNSNGRSKTPDLCHTNDDAWSVVRSDRKSADQDDASTLHSPMSVCSSVGDPALSQAHRPIQQQQQPHHWTSYYQNVHMVDD